MEVDKKKQNLSRKKIINSAIMLFANKGFDSTSTREICKQAGVNLSLIPYYFGNKDGLYISIIESVVSYGLSFLKEEIEKTSHLNNFSVNEKINLYRDLLEKFINFLYSENVPGSFVVLMIKEQTVTHSKFAEIYTQKINVLYFALRRILASLLNKKESDKYIILEVSSIIGQILGYKLMEKANLDALNQDYYTKEDCKRIKQIVSAYVENCIVKIEKQVQEPACS